MREECSAETIQKPALGPWVPLTSSAVFGRSGGCSRQCSPWPSAPALRLRRLRRAEFIRKGDAVCTQTKRELVPIPEAGGGGEAPPAKSAVGRHSRHLCRSDRHPEAVRGAVQGDRCPHQRRDREGACREARQGRRTGAACARGFATQTQAGALQTALPAYLQLRSRRTAVWSPTGFSIRELIRPREAKGAGLG